MLEAISPCPLRVAEACALRHSSFPRSTKFCSGSFRPPTAPLWLLGLSSSHTVINFSFFFLFCLMVARSRHHSRYPMLFPLAESHIPSLVLEPLFVEGKNIESPQHAPSRTSPSAWMDPSCDSCHSRPSLMPRMHSCSACPILLQPAPTP
jgi:hypothetical protein